MEPGVVEGSHFVDKQWDKFSNIVEVIGGWRWRKFKSGAEKKKKKKKKEKEMAGLAIDAGGEAGCSDFPTGLVKSYKCLHYKHTSCCSTLIS